MPFMCLCVAFCELQRCIAVTRLCARLNSFVYGGERARRLLLFMQKSVINTNTPFVVLIAEFIPCNKCLDNSVIMKQSPTQQYHEARRERRLKRRGVSPASKKS